jgi:flagellar biosynthesis/type III secretory pathway M-ring protein FliF/YscJ
MAYVIVFMLLVAVVLVVSSPLRRPLLSDDAAAEHARATREAEDQAAERLGLEAARDAKYREIRDAELDHQTGKLSDADYEATDSTLRAEAIDLLRHLDALEPSEGEQESDDAEEVDE